MCKLYSLSGASGTVVIARYAVPTVTLLPLQSGRHPCLWCLIKSCEMKIPLSSRGHSTKRTVEGILNDHQKFLSAGGNLKKAKLFNNCISKPFFNIPISQVHTSNTRLTHQLHVLTINNRCVCLDYTSPRGSSRRSSHSFKRLTMSVTLS